MLYNREEFVQYVASFYAEGQIYDMNFSREEIENALDIRLQNKELEFDGDSLDRELVRDIVIENRQIREQLELSQ
jgi:hypothetical protein